ncbi:predicted protein [Chaetoceros tenuissimus]|uniref:Uncharacterized protein n=1 Tax=Chaetoceros tenuissimus TaxID=426638 RepID=A0AAD3D8S7_9STRA|nr:predicted protein [Chaetoceros tenuissimus]
MAENIDPAAKAISNQEKASTVTRDYWATTETVAMTTRDMINAIQANSFLCHLLSPFPLTCSLNKEIHWYKNIGNKSLQLEQELTVCLQNGVNTNEDPVQQTISFLNAKLSTDEFTKDDMDQLKILGIDGSCSDKDVQQEQMTSSWSQVQIIASIRFLTLLIKVQSTHPQKVTLTAQNLLQNNLTCLQNSKRSREIRIYLSLLLKVIEPIAGLNAISASVWRSISDLSTTLSTLPQETFLDLQSFEKLLCLGIDRILVLIQQGKEAISCNTMQIHKMGKLVKFFLVRLLSLIPLLQSVYIEDKETLWKLYTTQFIHLKGGFRLLGQETDGGIYEIVLGLENKVEACLQKFMQIGSNVMNVESSSEASDSILVPKVLYMLCFLGKGVDEMFQDFDAFWFGKWLTLQTMVENINNLILEQQINSVSEQQLKSFLILCETLIWETMPMCYGYISSRGPASNNILLSLGGICNLFILLERMNITMTSAVKVASRAKLHCQLIKWLCGNGNIGPIHPISREVTLALIHMHVIRSFQQDFHSRNNVIRSGLSVSDVFMRLLVKMLLHQSTGRLGRQHVAIILSRLLDLESQELQLLQSNIADLLSDAVINLLVQMKENSSSKKRKRSSLVEWSIPSNMDVVFTIISRIMYSSNFAAKLDVHMKESLVSHFSALLLLNSGNNVMRLERVSFLTSKAPLLFSIVSSFLRVASVQVPLNVVMKSLSVDKTVDKLALFQYLQSQLLGDDKSIIQELKSFSQKCSCTGNIFGSTLLSSQLYKYLSNEGNHKQVIASIHSSLLSQKYTMVKIAAMLALEVFASKTPPSHRTVLPQCVPKESQLLLQARLKGHIFSWENRTVIPMKENRHRKQAEESLTLSSLYRLRNYMERQKHSQLHIEPETCSILLSDPHNPLYRATLLLSKEAKDCTIRDIVAWNFQRKGQTLTTNCIKSIIYL